MGTEGWLAASWAGQAAANADRDRASSKGALDSAQSLCFTEGDGAFAQFGVEE